MLWVLNQFSKETEKQKIKKNQLNTLERMKCLYPRNQWFHLDARIMLDTCISDVRNQKRYLTNA
jgi:hypothetical protein